jgi:pSer/pThr/pTyr-binding forkhead associated (FHA) protein
VSPFVLSVLKYALLVLLYFFIYRAVRSVAVDVSGRRAEGRAAGMKSRSVSTAKSSKGGKVPTAVIVHESDGDKPRSVRLSDRVDIGRADGCAIRLEDTYVSQVHARLAGKNGAWYLEDLGSTNGTYLNDRKVAAPVEVRAGDVVRVGKTVLELRR